MGNSCPRFCICTVNATRAPPLFALGTPRSMTVHIKQKHPTPLAMPWCLEACMQMPSRRPALYFFSAKSLACKFLVMLGSFTTSPSSSLLMTT